MSKQTLSPSFSSLLQRFFSEHLMQQKNVSPQTVASYRDTFRLLLRYMEMETGKSPAQVDLADMDSASILGFLNQLETERKNSIRSRNTRLAAIRSFYRFASTHDPVSLPLIQRVLAIPLKRYDRPLIGFLTREEIDAILAAPDRSTWSGRRDHAMFLLFYNTGARVSEVCGLQVGDLSLDGCASVKIRGKGRKERPVPLWKTTVQVLKKWLPQNDGNSPDAPLFPNRDGKALSRSGIEDRLERALHVARRCCPSLNDRQVSPHTLRHTTAMHLLQSGVDITVIALWLGHESTATTHQYVEADLGIREKALEKMRSPAGTQLRFQATDQLMTFLQAL